MINKSVFSSPQRHSSVVSSPQQTLYGAGNIGHKSDHVERSDLAKTFFIAGGEGESQESRERERERERERGAGA
jgi:hypothetical protein